MPSEAPSASPAALWPACHSSQEVAFQIAYPPDWYANTGLPDLPDCRLFGPTQIASADDPGIAIDLLISPPGDWTWGPLTQTFEGIAVLVDEEAHLATKTVWWREFELTADVDQAMEVGDRWTRYEFILPSDWMLGLEGDWLMTASTHGMPPGPEYDATLDILRQMMLSLGPSGP